MPQPSPKKRGSERLPEPRRRPLAGARASRDTASLWLAARKARTQVPPFPSRVGCCHVHRQIDSSQPTRSPSVRPRPNRTRRWNARVVAEAKRRPAPQTTRSRSSTRVPCCSAGPRGGAAHPRVHAVARARTTTSAPKAFKAEGVVLEVVLRRRARWLPGKKGVGRASSARISCSATNAVNRQGSESQNVSPWTVCAGAPASLTNAPHSPAEHRAPRARVAGVGERAAAAQERRGRLRHDVVVGEPYVKARRRAAVASLAEHTGEPGAGVALFQYAASQCFAQRRASGRQSSTRATPRVHRVDGVCCGFKWRSGARRVARVLAVARTRICSSKASSSSSSSSRRRRRASMRSLLRSRAACCDAACCSAPPGQTLRSPLPASLRMLPCEHFYASCPYS